VET
jgi:hypothetical protein